MLGAEACDLNPMKPGSGTGGRGLREPQARQLRKVVGAALLTAVLPRVAADPRSSPLTSSSQVLVSRIQRMKSTDGDERAEEEDC